MISPPYRFEEDSLGRVKVPAGAYWGPETQRAVKNFPVSGLRFPREFLRALGMIKFAAAEVNGKLGLLPRREGEAIKKAAWDVMAGKLDDQFPVDIFQTGSGTSTHMNANEVIAFRRHPHSGWEEKNSSERPCQSLPIQQRRHSQLHPYCRGGGAQEQITAGPGRVSKPP